MTAIFVPLPLPSEDALAPPPPLPEERADELRLRDEAADAPRLEALALLGLLRDADDPLFEDPLRLLLLEEPLRLLLLDALCFLELEPFELREVVCLLLDDRVLPWAMAPP